MRAGLIPLSPGTGVRLTEVVQERMRGVLQGAGLPVAALGHLHPRLLALVGERLIKMGTTQDMISTVGLPPQPEALEWGIEPGWTDSGSPLTKSRLASPPMGRMGRGLESAEGSLQGVFKASSRIVSA
jgi:hypothetical protein